MKAIILAGGFGTRLRPLTLNLPKPVVPIGNQPFLLRQIDLLKKAGIKDITLSLNYQPEAIQEILGNGSNYNVNLRYAVEPSPMGTAGAYKFAARHSSEATIVLNGDILTDIDLRAVCRKHANTRAAATLVLTRVADPSAYGLVETSPDGRVSRFLEKPNASEIEKLKLDTINAGIYVLEPEISALVPENEKYSFETQLFPSILEKKMPFYSYVSEREYWIDIGTHERYLQAHFDLMANRVGIFKLERTEDSRENNSTFKIDPCSILAEGCRIGMGAEIRNSVLGRNVSVEDGAVVRNSVIWADTRIGSKARIENSIVGAGCYVGRQNRLAKFSVLGDRTILADSDF